MGWSDLFLAKRQPKLAKAETIAASQSPPTAVGVFITPQSLVSFPVASALVAIIWALGQKLFGAGAQTPWVPLLIAVLLGAVIFISNVSAEDARPKSLGGWLVAVGIAILNSLLLAASALGILGTK